MMIKTNKIKSKKILKKIKRLKKTRRSRWKS